MPEDKTKAKTTTAKPKQKAALVKEHYTDDSGIPRVVFVPPGETNLQAGIPASLDLSELFGHMPDDFQARLYAALHAHGLIEASDYFKRGAAEAYQRALRDVLKHDFLSIQALAHKELHHG